MEHLEDAIFKEAYIPQNLDQVIDAERDVQRLQDGDVEEVSATCHFALKLTPR